MPLDCLRNACIHIFPLWTVPRIEKKPISKNEFYYLYLRLYNAVWWFSVQYCCYCRITKSTTRWLTIGICKSLRVRRVNYKYFFSIWFFFHKHSRFTGQQGKWQGIYLTPFYHFLSLHRHLDISRLSTVESSDCADSYSADT